MAYRIPLPEGGRSTSLDIVEPNTTAVQRFIRREGLGAYEPPTAAAMLSLCEMRDPGFVVYDVGANMGLYGQLAASMFSPSMVHAFEPAPASADIARRIGRRNRLALTVHQVAVSDQVGVAALHLSPVSDASNSLVEGFRDTDVHIDVPTTTIDAMVERTGDHPDIIKIDVETHERAVLDGARATIERDRPALIVEVLRRKGHDHGVEISEFLAGLGYRCFELGAEPDWHPHAEVRGSGTTDRDWLLLPDDLPVDFPERWSTWRDRLSACTVDRNPRLPVAASIGAALRRGGWREVAATADRYRKSRDRS
jgi:FkbM family methyltransferase